MFVPVGDGNKPSLTAHHSQAWHRASPEEYFCSSEEPLEFCCKCLGTRPAHHYISIQPVLFRNTAGHQFWNTASHHCFRTRPIIIALEHGQSSLLWNTASHHCFGTQPVFIAWNTDNKTEFRRTCINIIIGSISSNQFFGHIHEMCFDYSNKSKHEQDKLHWLLFHVPALQFSLQISSWCGIWVPVLESDVFPHHFHWSSIFRSARTSHIYSTFSFSWFYQADPSPWDSLNEWSCMSFHGSVNKKGIDVKIY